MNALPDIAENPRAVMGGNAPPPFEAFSIHIGELLEGARSIGTVENEAQSETVARIKGELSKAKADAEKAKLAETKPLRDQVKAINDQWGELIGSADTALTVCRDALRPWLEKLAAEQAAAAAEARRKADAEREAAQAAMREARAAVDLEAREAAEKLLKQAKKSEAAATRAEKARPQAKGGEKAVTLRAYWAADMENPQEALNWAVERFPDEIVSVVDDLAQQEVRRGIRTIPGFKVEKRRAVV